MTLGYLETIWASSQDRIASQNNTRTLPSIHPDSVVDFAGHDYLGLKRHPKILEKGYQNAKNYGVGSAASRLVLQHDRGLNALEEALCQYTQHKHAVFFPTAFVANMAFFDALAPFSWEEPQSCTIFMDHRAHASLFFGLKCSGLPHKTFRHNDYGYLERVLKECPSPVKIVVVESLYSMDGDFSDPEALVRLCRTYGALVFLDDVHGFGVYGHHGNGWANQYPDLKEVLLAVTLGCGKAVGVSGGFLVTNRDLFYQRVIQKCKPLIYSTAVSPFITGAVLGSLSVLQSAEGDQLRDTLACRVQEFLNRCGDAASPVLRALASQRRALLPCGIPAFILPLVIGDSARAVQCEHRLRELGLLLRAIRPPAVPQRSARLRLILTAAHTTTDVQKLVAGLENVLLAVEI